MEHGLDVTHHDMESNTKSQASETLKDAVASCIGSGACVYTGQPFDTVKVRMQVNPGGMYSSSLHCFRSTFNEEGLRALWKGSLPAFLGAVTENAVAFCTNNLIKQYIQGRDVNEKKEISYIEPFISGALTGAVTSFSLCPFDVLKCRSQVMLAQGGSKAAGNLAGGVMRTVFNDIITKQGVSGLYRGMKSQIVRDIPFYSSFFGSYEVFCALLQKNTDLPPESCFFLAGGFAGQVGWAVSIGPDTVKSNIQCSSEGSTSVIKTAQRIYGAKGLRGFFVGLEVAIIRAFPANAALFLGYESSREFLNTQFPPS